MRKITPSSAMLAGLLMASAGSASAGSVSFNNFVQYGSDAVNYVVTIDDDAQTGKNVFTVNVKIAENSPNRGDILGIAFDLNYEIKASHINGDDITKIGFNTLNNQGGNNFNGAGASEFSGGTPDVLLTIGNSGSGLDFISQTSFTIAILDDIALVDAFSGTVFGIRAQSVGPNGNGSAKDIAIISPDGGAPVPVPAAVWFMGTGLLGLLGFARARKTAVAA